MLERKRSRCGWRRQLTTWLWQAPTANVGWRYTKYQASFWSSGTQNMSSAFTASDEDLLRTDRITFRMRHCTHTFREGHQMMVRLGDSEGAFDGFREGDAESVFRGARTGRGSRST